MVYQINLRLSVSTGIRTIYAHPAWPFALTRHGDPTNEYTVIFLKDDPATLRVFWRDGFDFQKDDDRRREKYYRELPALEGTALTSLQGLDIKPHIINITAIKDLRVLG